MIPSSLLCAERLLKEIPLLLRFFPGQGVRLNRTPNGIIVVADLRSNPWNHPFRVAVSDDTATIANGTVNNLVPSIDGATIDGLDADGKEITPPTLDLSAGPGANNVSWVCVQVTVDLQSGAMDPKNKDALTIVHSNSLDPKASQGGSPDDGQGVGQQPLAMLRWDPELGAVKSAYQIVYHNLQHRYVKPGSGQGATGRHFFWAV